MTAPGEDWPDVEQALKEYLLADTGIAALIGGRVFLGVPRDSSDAFPCVKITRLGGGQDGSDAAIDLPLVQFDVYGKRSDEVGGGRGPTTRVLNALQKALSTIKGKTPLNVSVTAWDADVRSIFFSSLPADDRPRFVVTVAMTAMATG
jgi:hypothetical protein